MPNISRKSQKMYDLLQLILTEQQNLPNSQETLSKIATAQKRSRLRNRSQN